MSILFLLYAFIVIPKIILRRLEVAETARTVPFDEIYKHYPDWVEFYPKIREGLALRQKLAFGSNMVLIIYSIFPIIFLFTPHADDLMGFQSDFFVLSLSWVPLALTGIFLNASILFSDKYVEFEEYALTMNQAGKWLIWERRAVWATWIIYVLLGIVFLFVR